MSWAIAMVAQVRRSVLLADQGKLGETSRVRSREIGEIGTLVTNRAVDAEHLAAFRRVGVDVVT